GYRVVRIAEYLGIDQQKIHRWKRDERWDDAAPINRVEGALEARLVQLIVKDEKEGKDFKEIDVLGRQIERLARVHKYEQTGRETDLNPRQANGNKTPRKGKRRKNTLDAEQVAA